MPKITLLLGPAHGKVVEVTGHQRTYRVEKIKNAPAVINSPLEAMTYPLATETFQYAILSVDIGNHYQLIGIPMQLSLNKALGQIIALAARDEE